MLGETIPISSSSVTSVHQWLNLLRKTCELDFITRIDICRTLSKVILKDVTMSKENKVFQNEEIPSTSGSSLNQWGIDYTITSNSYPNCTVQTNERVNSEYNSFVLTQPMMSLQSAPTSICNFNFCQTPNFYYTGMYYAANFATCYAQTQIPNGMAYQVYKEQKLSSLRRWEWEKINKRNIKPGFIFTLMCYNILAQDLLDQHPHLYHHHDQICLDWDIRWNNLLNEITKFKPEILCLQEVQESHLESYFSVLQNLGYSRLYKKRTGVRTDGCALYYKSDVINLVEYTSVEYFQPNVPVLNRDNVGLIATFSQKLRPDNKFVVATTHLLYNPRRQDVRLAQMQVLLTEIERISYDPKSDGNYLPVILTGDLNSTPYSPVYQFITKGKLKYENLTPRSLQKSNNSHMGKVLIPPSLRITDNCQHADLLEERLSRSRSEELGLIELFHSERSVKKQNNNKQLKSSLFSTGTLSHNFAFKSVYNHGKEENTEGTTFQGKWLTVDYIFYSIKKDEGPAEEGKLRLLSKYRLPTAEELQGINIPNTELGSDHLSLVAKFKLHY